MMIVPVVWFVTSMNITYIIGNGFDLALGLCTDYPSFIKHYVDEMPQRVQKGEVRTDSPLLKLCENMKDNLETWADAERAFGRLKFSSMGDKAISVYDECYDDFLRSVATNTFLRFCFNSSIIN